MTDLERRVRRIVLAVFVLGVLACGFGTLPGTRVYDDVNNCFGKGIGSLFLPGHNECTTSYTKLVAERPAGGAPLIYAMAFVLGYGVLLWLFPRRWVAVGWPVIALGAGLGFFAGTFELDLLGETVTLWPSTVTNVLLGTDLVLIFLVTPIVALARTQATPPVAPMRVVAQ